MLTQLLIVCFLIPGVTATLTVEPQNVTVIEGSPAWFNCSSDVSTAKIAWFRNTNCYETSLSSCSASDTLHDGISFTANPATISVQEVNSPATRNLIIKATRAIDAASYHCVEIVSGGMNDYAVAYLTVEALTTLGATVSTSAVTTSATSVNPTAATTKSSSTTNVALFAGTAAAAAVVVIIIAVGAGILIYYFTRAKTSSGQPKTADYASRVGKSRQHSAHGTHLNDLAENGQGTKCAMCNNRVFRGENSQSGFNVGSYYVVDPVASDGRFQNVHDPHVAKAYNYIS